MLLKVVNVAMNEKLPKQKFCSRFDSGLSRHIPYLTGGSDILKQVFVSFYNYAE